MLAGMSDQSHGQRSSTAAGVRPGVGAGALVAIAVAGQALGFLVAMLVARRLDVPGFEAYAVAASLFILLASAAPLGAERHAVQALPALGGDVAAVKGLIGWGLRRTLGFALPMAAGVAAWALLSGADTGHAVLVTALSLPAGALAHYGVDLLTALGRPALALLLFRVAVPLSALLMVAFADPLTAPLAVGGWGLGWLLAAGTMTVAAHRGLPAGWAGAEARREPGWGRAARPFLVHRISMVVLAQAPLLALELADPAPGAVGAYAAAAATAGLVTVLATATNRAYARELSGLLAAGDAAAISAARLARLRWLVPAVAGAVAMLWLAPTVVLGWFRPEFVSEGVWPLRILSAAAGFTVLFALAPTWTKFRGQAARLYRLVAGAAAAELLLLALLVPAAGATGAAAAHAVAMVGLYSLLARAGWRDLGR